MLERRLRLTTTGVTGSIRYFNTVSLMFPNKALGFAGRPHWQVMARPRGAPLSVAICESYLKQFGTIKPKGTHVGSASWTHQLIICLLLDSRWLQPGVDQYKRALMVAPSYAPAHYNMGMVEFEEGNHEEALKHYQRAAEINPLYPEPHCNIGVVRKLQGDNRKAVEAYERCLQIAPNFTIARNNIAIALTHLGAEVKTQGNTAEAIKLYQRALTFNPQHAALRKAG